MKCDRKLKCGTTLRWRSIADMASAMRWALAEDEERGSATGRANWTGTESLEAYEAMLRLGWRDGIEGVEGLDGLATDASERVTFRRDVGGVFPVVPAHLAGVPDAMLNVRRDEDENARGLTLVTDLSFNSNVSAGTVLTYAQTIMKLLAWLQAERIETAVYATISVKQASKDVLYVFPVRQAGDVLQPERVAAMVHPSALRRGYFALCEYEYHALKLPGTSVCNTGYGRAQTPELPMLTQALPDAYSIILLPKPGAGDPEAAVREALNLKLRRN